jgi:tetratricopeptide (TPR) repeat protein
MKANQLLNEACALRDRGNFLEAYEKFVAAADRTDNLIEKAGILLNASTTLTAHREYRASRRQLDAARKYAETAKTGKLGIGDQDELFGVLVGVEIEEAEILSREAHESLALDKLTAILSEHQFDLQMPAHLTISDNIQARRAYLLADLGSPEKALTILTELEKRHSGDPIFLFYLGHCCRIEQEFERALAALHRALNLDPPDRIKFQVRCTLGMTYYDLQDYARAKRELEIGAKTAPSDYLKHADIWKWLEHCCRALGLTDEADHYALLGTSSS